MPPGPKPPRKPLFWMGGSKKSLRTMPEEVQDIFGAALLDVQYGDTPHGARPFGEGLSREIWKIVEDYEGNTYRAIYTVAFPLAVYVLDAFMKKSTSGIGTPKMVKERVRERFKAARQHYDANFRES